MESTKSADLLSAELGGCLAFSSCGGVEKYNF